MFPTLEYKVYGLKPEATYDVYVEMVLVDVNQWKFNSGQWIPSGQSEHCQKTSKEQFFWKVLQFLFNLFRSSVFPSGFAQYGSTLDEERENFIFQIETNKQ